MIQKVSTGSPWYVCSKVSEEDALAWNGTVICDACGKSFAFKEDAKHVLNCPATRGAAVTFSRPRMFPSLCDWFDEAAPIEWLADFLRLIHDTPNLDWVLLTKRPDNWEQRIDRAMLHLAKVSGGAGRNKNTEAYSMAWKWVHDRTAPHNVWVIVSAENQKWANVRLPKLFEIPARVRGVSAEPLLGPINFAGITGEEVHFSALSKACSCPRSSTG